jgi:predicted enzyme related to lactoylglutathione lyase
MSMHGTFIWYELMTPDAEASGRFYSAVVPRWTIGEPIPGEVNYRAIGRSDGGNAGGVLQIDESMRSHGARPAWLGYIGVDDVDAAVGQVQSGGGSVLMPAWNVPDVGRIAMVADPQGVPFYVMKPIPPAGREGEDSDVFSTTAEQRVNWNELTTPDPIAARAFYGELFGWTSDEFMPMGEMGEYRFLAHAGQTIGAVCGVQPGGSKGWRYYIRVPSIGRAVEAVKANGGSVSMGPHEVPGGDHIIIGQDPQGAEFALVGGA